MDNPGFTQTRPSPGAAAPGTASLAPLDHTDRDAFALRLQQHYHRYAVNDLPFLLIAMRGDGPAARPLDFSRFYQCVCTLLSPGDDWLVDLDDRRLLVLLAAGHSPDARRFYARLKLRLLEALPDEAEHYLHAIAAITLPNGAPFETAEDFLTVALEEA